MKDSRPLVQFIYEMQVEDSLNKMRTSYYPSIDADLFKWLQAESSVRLFDHPLHNKYINYYHHMRDPNTTPVYCPSQVYQFDHMRHEVVLENHLKQREEISPCVMIIYHPFEAVMDSLLSNCSQIWKHQPVTYMYNVTCNNPTIPPPRLTHAVMVDLYDCKFPDDFVEKILRQLFGCGNSLQRLKLILMNLKRVESLLD